MTERIRYYEHEALFHGFIARVMGTRFDLLLIGCGRSAAEEVWREVAGELECLDRMLNRFDPASEVSRLGAAAGREPVAVSAEMEAILRLCADYHRRTEGLFDVTLHDFSRVTFTAAGCVSLGGGETTLDFGGFAKGYALRKIGARLRRAGVRDAFVDFGGSSILGLGSHPYGSGWKVSLPDPRTGRPLDEFLLSDRALSTSGNTATHTAHIVHPLTQRYATARAYAALVADDPLDAEVLSTVRMIAGEAEWGRIAPRFAPMQATLYTL